MKNTTIISDFRGVMHWVLNDNEFVYNYTNYERDEESGRCYMLVYSCNLRPEYDGALVRRRIKKLEYEKALASAKQEISDYENATGKYTYRKALI